MVTLENYISGTPIFCDTNIWYDLATGSIPPEKISGLNLILIPNTLYEFASSPKLASNPLLVQQASLIALRKSSIFIPGNSLDRIISVFDQCYHTDNYIYFTLLEHVRLFSQKREQDLLGLNTSIIQTEIDNSKAPLKEIAQKMNTVILPQIKTSIPDIKEHFSIDNEENIINLLNKFIETYTGNTSVINQDNKSNILNISMLLKTWGLFFKKLETGNSQFTPNDWYDLFNLAFVDPNSLYWTRDRKWINLINEAGFNDQLFELENSI